MRDLFVGVDAGGSHTVAALARGERVLRTVSAQAANPTVAGADGAAAVIASSIEAVLEGETAAAIGVGVAGAGSNEVCEQLLASPNRRLPSTRIALCHDARIALRAVLPDGDGIVLIAGTGSIAYAEAGRESFRAGGYGYLLGDAGSGYAIGAAALRDLADAGDRSVLDRIYQSASPVAQIASYAPIVLRRAAAGDDRALAIVRHAAGGLVELIRSIVRQCAKPALPLAFSGGLLRERNALVDSLEQQIAAASLDVRVVATRAEPYFGALSEARRMASA